MTDFRELSLKRKVNEVLCVRCGSIFKARDTRAKYCSDVCRVMAYKHRKRQATQYDKSSASPSSS
jgi:ferredoxin